MTWNDFPWFALPAMLCWVAAGITVYKYRGISHVLMLLGTLIYAVFIGGHGGRLADMLRKIDGVMRPGGVIVFNSVSEESRQLFTDGLAAIGGRITECVRLTVDAHNAIDVMKGACGPRRI